jgi:hypothetical protein
MNGPFDQIKPNNVFNDTEVCLRDGPFKPGNTGTNLANSLLKYSLAIILVIFSLILKKTPIVLTKFHYISIIILIFNEKENNYVFIK